MRNSCIIILVVLASGCSKSPTICEVTEGEYIAKPVLEINACGDLLSLPSVMFLDMGTMEPEFQQCGSHLLLDKTFQQFNCILRERKTLEISRDKKISGDVILEAKCEATRCMNYWSLNFRRIEDER